MLNSFCVDLEEWFHVCGVDTPFRDPQTWDAAPRFVERDTERLLQLLDDTATKATFLTLGWIAEKYPELVRRIAEQGHEIGCHGYYHRLVYEMTRDEFREDIRSSRKRLQDASGQAVTSFRAPSFSVTQSCLWAFAILAEEGFEIDVSVVPARRDNGGIVGFPRHPFHLQTNSGGLKVYPVSVMAVAGRLIPFSGGGYLRLFPLWLVRRGCEQNRRLGVPIMSYIHPREINPQQPRLNLPLRKRTKYYVGLHGCETKLRRLLTEYRFGTLSQALNGLGRHLPKRVLSSDSSAIQLAMPQS